MRNDVALVELAEASTATPVSLSKDHIDTDATLSADEQDTVVLGWGALQTDGYGPDDLQKAVLTLLTRKAASTPPYILYEDELYPGMVCAYADNKDSCTVRVFRQKFTLEDGIGSHACSLEANTRVTNGIPLRSSLLTPVCTVNCVQTLKAKAILVGLCSTPP
jgi:hypothetical protein